MYPKCIHLGENMARYKAPYTLYVRGKVWYYRTCSPEGLRTAGISTGCTAKCRAREYCVSQFLCRFIIFFFCCTQFLRFLIRTPEQFLHILSCLAKKIRRQWKYRVMVLYTGTICTYKRRRNRRYAHFRLPCPKRAPFYTETRLVP